MSRVKTSKTKDGRRARSVHSRKAIKTALFDMMHEGFMAPTIQLISERAGVGIRTVFRQFDDIEGLFCALNDDLNERNAALFLNTLSEGALGERMDSFMVSRRKLYEKNKNIFLSTLGLMWKYPTLKVNYEKFNQTLRNQMRRVFPEILERPKHIQQLIEALASFEVWHRLTQHQKMNPQKAIELMRAQILQILSAG